MIDINFRSQRERGAYALHIRGHANYAPSGRDIICAAVSTLGYTFAAVVRRMDADGELIDRPLIRESEGELWIQVRARETYRAALAQSFDTVRTGLALLAEHYPAYVHLR